MTDADFDPLNAAAALELLDSELREDLGGEHAEQALFALKAELATVVAQAHDWVERHRIPSECIPYPPTDDCNAEECRAFLYRLAGVLSCLGTQVALSPAMRDIDQTVADTCRGLMALQGKTMQLNDDVGQFEGTGQMTGGAGAAIRSRARRMLEIVEAVLSGLEEFPTAGGSNGTGG